MIKSECCNFEVLSELVYYDNLYKRFINVLEIKEIAAWPLEVRQTFFERLEKIVGVEMSQDSLNKLIYNLGVLRLTFLSLLLLFFFFDVYHN